MQVMFGYSNTIMVMFQLFGMHAAALRDLVSFANATNARIGNERHAFGIWVYLDVIIDGDGGMVWMNTVPSEDAGGLRSMNGTKGIDSVLGSAPAFNASHRRITVFFTGDFTGVLSRLEQFRVMRGNSWTRGRVVQVDTRVESA